MNAKLNRETPDISHLIADHLSCMLAYWAPDLRCLYANRAYEEWFDVAPNSLIGKSKRELLGTKLFNLNEPYINTVLKGQAQVFEEVVPGHGGIERQSTVHYIPDIVNSKVKGFLVQITETTKLKETETALLAEIEVRKRAFDLLQESNSRLREAQRLGQIGSWEWDVVTDVVSWSDELYGIHNYDPLKLPPKYAELSELYTKESWESLNTAVERALKTGQPYTLELEYLKPGGNTGWIEARGEAVRNEEDNVVKLRGTVLEITVRRQIQEARLQRDLAQAASQNKTEILSRATHELRTPLNGVLGCAQLIMHDPATSAYHSKLAKIIVNSGWHMLELVDQILDLSSAEQGRIDVTRIKLDVDTLVLEALQHFMPLAKESHIELRNQISNNNFWQVLGDAKWIQLVIRNLVSNAIKYNQPGGCVTLSAKKLGRHVEVRVEDTGIGMSGEQLSRLFAPFERLGAEKTRVKGTGMSLALSKKLVELMGGHLNAESQVGVGSTFTATFPTAVE